MIPYDDLVAALATWRARQGLPVAQPASATAPPPRAPAPPPPAARTAPPAPPPRAATSPRPAVPPPAPVSANDFDEGEGALGEAGHYEISSNDYATPFGGMAIEQSGESTAIGGAPEAPIENLPVIKRGKRNPDW